MALPDKHPGSPVSRDSWDSSPQALTLWGHALTQAGSTPAGPCSQEALLRPPSRQLLTKKCCPSSRDKAPPRPSPQARPLPLCSLFIKVLGTEMKGTPKMPLSPLSS